MSSKNKTTATKEEAKPALVPKLRFPEFQGAEGWERTQLESALSSISNGLVLEQSTDTSGFRVTRIETISAGTIDLEKVGLIKTSQDISAYKLRVGDILLSNINSVAHIGKTVFVDRDYDLYHGMNLLRLGVNRAQHDPRFIFYLINTDGIRASLRERANKAVNQASINQTELGKTAVAVPHKPEQQKIAECLSSVDELMAAQARKVDALKTHKKGLMQQLFPREGETQPRLRFPEFQNAGEWAIDRLDVLLEVIDGDRGTNYPKAEDYSQSGYCLFLSAANVSKTGFKFEAMQFVSKDKDNSLRKGKLKRADVVLTTRGTVGQFAFYSEDIPHENIRINSGMVILRIKGGKIVPAYLYCFTSSEVLRAYIKSTAFGNAQQQITVGEINKFQIYYPGPDEQQRITNCLSTLDAVITAETQKLDTLKTHKKGLMQQLFPSPEAMAA